MTEKDTKLSLSHLRVNIKDIEIRQFSASLIIGGAFSGKTQLANNLIRKIEDNYGFDEGFVITNEPMAYQKFKDLNYEIIDTKFGDKKAIDNILNRLLTHMYNNHGTRSLVFIDDIQNKKYFENLILNRHNIQVHVIMCCQNSSECTPQMRRRFDYIYTSNQMISEAKRIYDNYFGHTVEIVNSFKNFSMILNSLLPYEFIGTNISGPNTTNKVYISKSELDYNPIVKLVLFTTSEAGHTNELDKEYIMEKLLIIEKALLELKAYL